MFQLWWNYWAFLAEVNQAGDRSGNWVRPICAMQINNPSSCRRDFHLSFKIGMNSKPKKWWAVTCSHSVLWGRWLKITYVSAFCLSQPREIWLQTQVKGFQNTVENSLVPPRDRKAITGVSPHWTQKTHQVIKESFTSFSKLKQYIPPDGNPSNFILICVLSVRCKLWLWIQNKLCWFWEPQSLAQKWKPVVIVKENMHLWLKPEERWG